MTSVMVQPVDDGWTEKRPLIDACRKRAAVSYSPTWQTEKKLQIDSFFHKLNFPDFRTFKKRSQVWKKNEEEM